ncbi:NADH-quinone oxidoreductase subunit J [Alicyclobacillus tolerans]|uniref:NADH-quinone oxidoreductase subunit J n=1 Tax=Alicyclobacillus tolerans TaxID=90970 RepID=UPI001F259331|nr:NADH-quinone oxidoreductase subunit J [Alicyclobacillus tolerans]MCF8567169.1 NADH-quinone oxidoreductase subunit J [Alicyclobacillus tolerans]
MSLAITPALIAFFIISLGILGCAVMLLSFRKVIYMALAIGGVFIGASAIYFLLGAPFVGIAQIMIYAGAITILIMFAIMLTNHEATEPPFEWNAKNIFSTIGAVLLAIVLLVTIRSTAWPQGDPTVNVNGSSQISNPVAIGQMLYTQYTIPFELVSLLLIVALVGAVIIAQERQDPKDRKENE